MYKCSERYILEKAMTLFDWTPWAALAVLIIAMALIILSVGERKKGAWMVPAVFSAALFLWSVWTIVEEGVAAVWTEHTRSFWGNQIWFDLLLGIGLSLFLIAPRAKDVGMKLWMWLVLILCTGNIATAAMVSRYLYLAEKKA